VVLDEAVLDGAVSDEAVPDEVVPDDPVTIAGEDSGMSPHGKYHWSHD
jgi:hypothetical protein